MTSIIYIAGKGRSGSTLLDRLLGQVDGVFSAGELWRLWHVREPSKHQCGCSRPLNECAVWSRVLEGIDQRNTDVDRIRADQQLLFTWKVLPRLAVGRSRIESWPPMRRYVAAMDRVYEDLATITGSRAVVDSSKWPFDPIAVSTRHSHNVQLVHLIRDVRAVAFSWQRKKQFTDRAEPEPMPRFGTVHSVASWTARNLSAEWMSRYTPVTRVRYEDLVREPLGELTRIATLVNLEVGDLRLDDGRIDISPTHTVAGNPGRMHNGPVAIRVDDAWLAELDSRSRRMATVLGWPLLARYGYL